MFKFIGGAVVCGFALYGLARYLGRPVVNVVIDPGVLKKREAATSTAEEGGGASPQVEKGPADTADDRAAPAAS